MKKIFFFAIILLTSGSLANNLERRHPLLAWINKNHKNDPYPDLTEKCIKNWMAHDFNDKSCKEHACKNGGILCQHNELCVCLRGTYGDCCSGVTSCLDEEFCGQNKTATCQFSTSEKKAVCVCSTSDQKFDYREKKCKKPCEKDDDCENGGKCTGHGKFKFCECLPGTDGDFCSEVTKCKENDFCGTSNEATCIYDSLELQAMCNCLDTSKSFDFQEKTCKMPCRNDTDCPVDHKCIGEEGLKFCECTPGKTVNICSHVTDCHEPDSCGTGNDVTCEYDTVQLKGKCKCWNSSEQFDYREKICKEPCQDGDCENGGKCTGYGEFKFCECLPGTAGDHCSEVTECKEADFCGKGNDTMCIYNSTRFEAMCQCLNSSKHFDYKDKVCKKTCEEGDCENGANCNLSEDFAFCECLPGTAGDVCSEVVDCKEDNVCGTYNDSICAYDSLRREAICQCSDPDKQFDYMEKTCRSESKGNTFSALIGSLFAFLIIAFSGLFYLYRRKQKAVFPFLFKKLKEPVGDENEQRVKFLEYEIST